MDQRDIELAEDPRVTPQTRSGIHPGLQVGCDVAQDIAEVFVVVRVRKRSHRADHGNTRAGQACHLVAEDHQLVDVDPGLEERKFAHGRRDAVGFRQLDLQRQQAAGAELLGDGACADTLAIARNRFAAGGSRFKRKTGHR